MNKELTPLKALDYLEEKLVESNATFRSGYFEIIETALNDERLCKYIINKVCAYLGLDMESHRDLIETENEILNTLVKTEKNSKVLEIIKNKEVNIFIFLHSGDLETYNDMVEDNRKLTNEEYDLLKEVLL
jgi:hypothetical protein